MIREIRNILNYITESSVDFPREGLCKHVWVKTEGGYKLKPELRAKILDALKQYPRFNLINIAKEIHIIGSITSNLYDDESDVDIHVLPDEEAVIDQDISKEDLQKEIMKWYKSVRDEKGWYAGNHPFEVYLQLDPNQDMLSDGVYDILNDKWIKKSEKTSMSYDPYEVYKHVLDNLKDMLREPDAIIGEIRRDIIDYKRITHVLSRLPKKAQLKLKLRLREKLSEIEKDILELVKDKEAWKELRKRFSTTTDGDQAVGDLKLSQQWKDANATFKFLDRYLYVKLISDLEKLVSDKELEPTEIDNVEKILNSFYEG